MKLITFFFFLGIFQVSASVYGQRGTVTLNLNELTMEDIFTAINRQLKYDIFYSDDELDVVQADDTDPKAQLDRIVDDLVLGLLAHAEGRIDADRIARMDARALHMFHDAGEAAARWWSWRTSSTSSKRARSSRILPKFARR